MVSQAPYNLNLAVTTSDSTDLVPWTASGLPTSALYVGVTGDVVTAAADNSGSLVTWKAVPAGTFLPIAVRRVQASGTSATNLVACYWE